METMVWMLMLPLVAGMLLMLLFMVLLCVWLYKDAKAHGQNPVLWVLVAIFASPILALLLYFIFARTDYCEPCGNCQYPVPRRARHCQNCGQENPHYGEPAPRTKLGKLGTGMLVAGVLAFLLLIGTMVGLVAYSLVNVSGTDMEPSTRISSTIEMNSGWAVIHMENHSGGVWNFRLSKSSNDYHMTSKVTLSDPASQKLVADLNSVGETFTLQFIQNDKVVEEHVLSGVQGQRDFSLSGLEAGTVKLRLINNGATEVEGSIWIE